MLQINKAAPIAIDDPEGLRGSSFPQLFASFKGLLRRQLVVFLVLTPCITALALLYLFITPPSFTANSLIEIGTRKVQVLPQQAVLGDITLDAQTVDTEVQILNSPKVSLSVIKQLRLTSDPEFVGDGLFKSVLKLVPGAGGSDEKPSELQLTNRALGAFESRRTVTRRGQTYLMEIGFRSLDPIKSARIANAIADAYFSDQFEAKYEAARRASAWLEDRIKELRTQASGADQAAVSFRRANNIVQSGKGLLMNEQQVSEANTQLILARAATAESKARLDRILEVMRQDVPDASVADALKNDVIIHLRNQFLDYAARERIWTDRYGANHLATINLRTQMLQLQQNIKDEMKKIAGSYKSDYEIAVAREQSLSSSLARVVSESQSTNQAEIQLRELESTAQSYRTIYDNFLQRYMESIQQQSFPITESRLVGLATPPDHKSHPNTFLVLAISTAGSLMLSLGVAFFRNSLDRTFRTSAQVEEILGTNCIATLPALKLANPPPDGIAKDVAPTVLQRIVHKDDLFRYVVDFPLSQFAEGVRTLKVVMDLSGTLESKKVIGITSSLPDEGKSTVASNFAHLIAHAGERVILIDCDLRNPSLSRRLAPDADVGLVDVIAGKIDLGDALWTDTTTRMIFLPAGASSRLLHTNKILASEAMRNSINSLRGLFDYVVVDLPPLAPVVDTRSTINFINSYVYVVEWGSTNRDMAEKLLAEAQEIYDRLLGVIMNKADMNVMSRYEGLASHYKYRKSYSRYGYIE